MRKLLITIGLITGAGSLFAGPIHDAARTGDLEKIKSLVNSGVDIDSMTKNNDPYTPLHIATSNGEIKVVDLLIELGANLDIVSYSNGDTALLNSIQTERNEIAIKLILKGASLDQIKGADTTPLIAACIVADETVIDLLLLKGVDINQKDEVGATAIHALADSNWRASKKLTILKQFISKGANINAIASLYSSGAGYNNFVTPLDLAYEDPERDYDRIDLLLENGAKTATQVLEDRLSSLEQKVEQGSTGNTNPTDEWPRKMWEIDFKNTLRKNSQFLNATVINKAAYIHSIGFEDNSEEKTLWITSTGISYDLNLPRAGHEYCILYLDDNSIVLEDKGVVRGFFRSNNKIIKRTFNATKLDNRYRDTADPDVPFIRIEIAETKITAWDFTPPTLASTENEGGNNGGNTAMSRLSIGTSGPDISIATDGKLGGPAELQKSNDLKNWRKLGDVPADSAELLITPRDSGNEFFRLKRAGE